MRGLNLPAVLVNRAAAGVRGSSFARGFFFFNRAAAGVRGSSFARGFFFNRAAVGWAVYARQVVYFFF